MLPRLHGLKSVDLRLSVDESTLNWYFACGSFAIFTVIVAQAVAPMADDSRSYQKILLFTGKKLR
jgi:hypothetical protein